MVAWEAVIYAFWVGKLRFCILYNSLQNVKVTVVHNHLLGGIQVANRRIMALSIAFILKSGRE